MPGLGLYVWHASIASLAYNPAAGRHVAPASHAAYALLQQAYKRHACVLLKHRLMQESSEDEDSEEQHRPTKSSKRSKRR